MLGIGKLAAGQQAYYLSLAKGVEDYYTGHGEAPGRWMGTGAAILDLGGVVDGEDLTAVLEGRAPEGSPGGGHRLNRAKLPGFDFTFRAPKSVSLLYGLGEAGPVTGEVVEAHEAAVDAAIGYLEQTVCFSRRRIDGEVTRFPGDGFVAAGFRHQTSRAGDPTLHTHVLVANATRFDDGRWGALDARPLYTHAKTAGFLYQAQLRAELTRRLGVEWEPVINGHADVAGIPRQLVDEFSTRRAEIEARMAERGEHSAKAAQFAALDTRKAKSYDVDAEALRAGWADRAEALGFGPTEVAELLGRFVARQPEPPDVAALLDELASAEGVTAHASTFTRRDVLQGIVQRLPEGADVALVEALADRFLDDARLVELPAETLTSRDVIRRRDGETVTADPEEVRYTTAELLDIEQRLTVAADRAQDAGVGIAERTHVEMAIDDRPSISHEQAEMVRHVCGSGAGIDPVVGAAGTGKTYTLDAARDAWQLSGYRVYGAALSARAAAELRSGSGIPATTIASLMGQLDRGQLTLDPDCVVVIDEASMVGTRTLDRLAGYTTDAGAKLVLVGDFAQLPEIDAGGAFRAIAYDLDAPQLAENRRQVAEWERDALDALRSGRVAEAVSAYDDRDRIVTADNAEVLRQRLVDDWWADQEQGHDGLMIAGRRADVADLNDRAQALLLASGEIDGEVAVTAGGRTFYGGDTVLATTANHYDLDILNGDVGYISGVTGDGSVIFWSERVDAERTMPVDLIESGHLELGYARTNYKTQGATVDRVYVLGDDGDLDRQSAYTALSRGRISNRLYVLEPDHDLDLADDVPSLFDPNPQGAQRPEGRELLLDHVERELSRDRSQHLATEALQGSDVDDAPTIDLRELPDTLGAAWAEADGLDRRINVAAAYDPTDRIARLDAEMAEVTAKLDTYQGLAAEAQERLDGLSGVRGVGRKTARHEARMRLDSAERSIDYLTERVDGFARGREPLAAQLDAHRAWLTDTEGDRARREQLAERIGDLAWDAACELEENPPGWLTQVIGHSPASDDARGRWLECAAQVVSYRTHHDVADDTYTLGNRPDFSDTAAQREYDDVRQTITVTQRAIARLEPDRARDLGLGVERDHGLDIGL